MIQIIKRNITMFLLIIVFLTTITVLMVSKILIYTMATKILKDSETFGEKLPHRYSVWSPACKIFDLDPFSEEVLEFYEQQEYEPCTNKQPLTEIVQDFVNDTVIVKFHRELVPSYLNEGRKYFECCHYEIFRNGSGSNADNEFRLSDCNFFENDFELPKSVEFVLIQCSDTIENVTKENLTMFYTNAHALIRRKNSEQESQIVNKKPVNILMFGIDSVSRLNLWRAMPETAKHLQDTGWFELQGYNKMAENTFPNLMAILTGLNYSDSQTICDPTKLGKLDDCQFIWKDFKANGYATAFAEDEASINTFNFNKLGFLKPPTDHYFRPFALAAETYLDIEIRSSLSVCVGYQNYVDHVYQYGIDFAKIYQNQSYFGLFWSNSFSHEDLSDPSFMDLKIKAYLDKFRDEGILNSSIVVFYSDHGMRYGPARELITGWLEERLPFIFIWLPESFQKEHPDIAQNLKINRNHLSTPYDLHMTLKHILMLSGVEAKSPAEFSSIHAQSLFKEIPWNRSCEDAGIDEHWCTCSPPQEINKNTKETENLAKFAIDEINFYLHSFIDSQTCAKLQLDKVIAARKFENSNAIFTEYSVLFSTLPSNASFEATIRYFVKTNKFELFGPVGRINPYGSQSDCIDIVELKYYCYCIV